MKSREVFPFQDRKDYTDCAMSPEEKEQLLGRAYEALDAAEGELLLLYAKKPMLEHAGKPVTIRKIEPEYEFVSYTGSVRNVDLSLRMAPIAIGGLFADWVNAYIRRLATTDTNVTKQFCKSYEAVFFVGGKMGITLKLEKKA